MIRILVTNDDGLRSEGLEALATALETLGEVVAVAPMLEASAIGHGVTLRRPLRLERIQEGRFGVDGTPTDCVNVAVTKVLGGLPDLVVSGINKGLNLGDDVTYSGTVAAALEGALLGVPSMAVSLERVNGRFDFTQAASVAIRLAEAVLASGLPARTFLNINVPQAPALGIRTTVQGRRNHVTAVSEALDPRQQPYFWIEEGDTSWEPQDRSDYQAVSDGWISLTPLHPDLTNYAALDAVEELSSRSPAEVE